MVAIGEKGGLGYGQQGGGVSSHPYRSRNKNSQSIYFVFIISIKYLFICRLCPDAKRIIYRIIYIVQCAWKYN